MMVASTTERRFYQAFFRWSNALRLPKHGVHPTRPFSLSATRRTENDKPSSLNEIDEIQREDVPTTAWRPNLGPEAAEISESDGMPPPEGLAEANSERSASEYTSTIIRNVFRSVAHPVAIVTAVAESEDSGSEDASFGGQSLTNEYEEAIDRLRAMTVSSLNTVSLDPEPIVSFNIRTPSSTWDAIQANKSLRIHLLRPTPRARDVALSFAKGETRQGFVRQMSQGMSVDLNRPGGALRLRSGLSEWLVLQRNINPNPAPYLKSRAFCCCLVCELRADKCVQINDHVIVVATVKRVLGMRNGFWNQPGKPRAATLSYFNHDFVSVDRPVTATGARDKASTAIVHPAEHEGGSFKKVETLENNEKGEGENNVVQSVLEDQPASNKVGDGQKGDGKKNVVRFVKSVKSSKIEEIPIRKFPVA